MADKHAHERKGEGDNRLFYHELRLPSVAALFMSNFRLTGLHNFVTATGEAFDDECPDLSHDGAVVLVLTVTGDHEGDWKSGNLQPRLSSGYKLRCMVLNL